MATGSTAPHRALSFNLASGKFERLPGGALFIRDVPALAVGDWTDSHVQTALFYPARTLEQYASNWLDNGFYYEHTGGRGHSSDERIGEVVNPRFGDGAIRVDILMSAMNPKSREMIAKIESGEVNMVSIEHAGVEELVNGRLEARTLEIYGLVPVVKGACKKCKIRNNAAPTCGDSDSHEGSGMELKELQETFAGKADTVKELAEVRKELEILRTNKPQALVDVETKTKELAEALNKSAETIKAQDSIIKELAEKVKKLEAAPAGTKTTVAQDTEDKDAVYLN